MTIARSDRALPHVLVAVLALGVLPIACQVVAGIDRVAKEPGAADGSTDGSTGPSSSDPCVHARPAPKPEQDDDRDGELPPFFLAIRKFSTSTSDIGFDLDNVCTGDRRPGTSREGRSSCTAKGADIDGDGGIDNNGTRLFATFADQGFTIDDAINNDIAEGSRGFLLFVSKYNGKLNDKEVTIGAMLTNGIRDGAGCGSNVSQFGYGPPKWCGHDLWSYSKAQTKPSSKEPISTGNGYVTNGVLVFTSDLPLTMFFGSAKINFGSPITMGRIEKKADGFWKVEATLAGRIPVNELVGAVGNFPNPIATEPDQRLCGQAFFPVIKTALCGAVDINRGASLDFADGPCDAISMAATFVAEQVDVGDVYEEPVNGNPCSADKAAPGAYTCP